MIEPTSHPLSAHQRDFLARAVAIVDLFAWSYGGEFGGDPTPNLQPRDAHLLDLSHQFVAAARAKLTEQTVSHGRPRLQCVPPSPDDEERLRQARIRQDRQRELARRAMECDAEAARLLRARGDWAVWTPEEAATARHSVAPVSPQSAADVPDTTRTPPRPAGGPR
jgi:hypothetical protein